MGSLILFVLGVAAPLAAALAVLWGEERRRSYARMRVDRLSQDNRGLKLALGTKQPGPDSLSLSSEADRREAQNLIKELAEKGVLLDALRGGARPQTQAAAAKPGAGVSPALKQAVAEWGEEGLTIALEHLKARLSAIAEMEMIWADPHSNVRRDPTEMLERTLWVFEPEYMVGEGGVEIDNRYGAIAKPVLGAGLYPGVHSKEGEPTLLVDLKNARVTIGADQQLQAWNNVRDLIRGGAIRERDPVDVYVVGGAVDELDGNPRVEGRYRNVRITSFDYGQLIVRAKRLTFGLYDDLKDSAPFLRQHRDAIEAAEQAAADEAASEASVSADEPEDRAREAVAATPTGPRRETFPPEPRRETFPPERPVEIRRPPRVEAAPRREPDPPRPEFEGDHVVIGSRKRA